MLDGTERDPLNPIYTCVVKMISRGQYITGKKALREGDWDIRKTKSTQKKTLETKELNLFQRKNDRYISANLSINVRFNRFSFKVNLVLGHPRSTNFIVWAFNV